MAHDGRPDGPRRLTRSHDRKLGGVAAGLAEYFDVDPTLIRVLFVIALFLPGVGMGAVIAYVIMWWVIPAPSGEPPPASPSGGGMDASLFLGILIIAVGAFLLLGVSRTWTSWIGLPGGAFLWPLLLIAVGAFIIVRPRR